MNAREALETILEKLTNSNGYYSWTPMGEPRVWLLRIPRPDRGDENWQKNERADFIHLCRPTLFLKAMNSNKREDMAHYCGYVVDGKCVRCERNAPEEIDKKVQLQIKLHALSIKTES